MRFYKIYPDCKTEIIEADSDNLLKVMQEAVGGFIEFVRPKRLEYPYCMIVNKEGLIENLKFNPVGSYLYQTDLHGSPMVGTIIIAKDSGAGDILSLTDNELKEVENIVNEVIIRISPFLRNQKTNKKALTE